MESLLGLWKPGVEGKEYFKLLHDSTPAATFCTPGRCWAVTVIFSASHKNAKICSSLSKIGSLAEPLLTTAMTAALSHRQQTLEPDQWLPHKATHMTMATSSVGAMVTVAQC